MSFLQKSKKASSNFLMGHLVYIILLGFVVFGLFSFAQRQQEGTGIWEQYYSSFIANSINRAEAGDELIIDIHYASEVAIKRKFNSIGEIVLIDGTSNKVCVKLSHQTQTCYNYFKKFSSVEYEIKESVFGSIGEPRNLLIIKFGG